MKTYSQMKNLASFEERLEYLKMPANVGDRTFGGMRHVNQDFYRSSEWKQVRNAVIVRDDGCDLGCPDRPIQGKIYIHHIEPLTVDILVHGDESALSLDNLVCVSKETHEAIHYGRDISTMDWKPRKEGDTKLW